jgi:hypothetical protein
MSFAPQTASPWFGEGYKNQSYRLGKFYFCRNLITQVSAFLLPDAGKRRMS